MYPVKTPKILRWPYPELIWNVKTPKKEVFLTFDDGPIPEITSWVMDQLKAFDAQAMFFMVGENITKHPEVYQEVITRGYGIGNHTYNHLNGWKTSTNDFIDNVELCAQKMNTSFLRPPHGRIKRTQLTQLKKDYNIVMWDVLSGDFDLKIDSEQCVSNVIDNVSNGSILVFHDSIKAWPRLKDALPKVLEELKKQGYTFGDLRSYYTSK